MLRLRRAELEAAMAAAAARLAQVEARLRSIESEGHMPTERRRHQEHPRGTGGRADRAPPRAYEPEDIGPVISPLYDELFRRLEAAGRDPDGPRHRVLRGRARRATARSLVHAAVHGRGPAPGPARTSGSSTCRAVERAATIVHRGSMDAVVPTAQTLARWIDADGHRSAGYAREINLECPADREKWVTELQEPLA